MKTLLRITDHDIRRIFGDRDATRGRTYQTQGRVSNVRIESDGEVVLASVQGSDQLPYEVEVSIKKRGGRIEILSECTCPVGYMCKHGAAALYEAIAEENRRHEKIAPTRGGGRAAPSRTGMSASLANWLKEYEALSAPQTAESESFRLVYLIGTETVGRKSDIRVSPALMYPLKNSRWGKPRLQTFAQIQSFDQYRGFLQEEDRAVFRLAPTGTGGTLGQASVWQAPADPDLVDLFLRRVIATGRAFSEDGLNMPLRQGRDMTARLGWTLQPDGRQAPTLIPARKGLILLLSSSCWYIDPETQEAGPLRTPLSHERKNLFLDAPPVTTEEAAVLRQRLPRETSVIPPPCRVSQSTTPGVQPIACLRLVMPSAQEEGQEFDKPEGVALLTFDYDGADVLPTDPTPHYAATREDQILLFKRDKKAEAATLEKLEAIGLHPTGLQMGMMQRRGQCFAPSADASPWYWLDFIHLTAPELRRAGFRVTIDKSFTAEIVEPDDDNIDANFTQNGDWWFSLDLGINVGGQRTPLLPLLVGLIRNLRSMHEIAQIAAGQKCYAPLTDGRFVALSADRVKTILTTLIELYGEKPLDEDGTMKISFDIATAFSKIEALTSTRWMGDEKMLHLIEKLGHFEGIVDNPAPKGLHAELRPYQKQGYNWLHFLNYYGLGGVLADDMGLGKTIQTLSFILSLKEKEKLKKPCLVVMPTSLVGNWASEAARFTPALRVLVLHGKTRAEKFKDIEKADLVFSTYPLITRDIEILKETHWSLVILDEAQAIKNPTAKMTQAACELEADQRLCLTGTPVENHLGEAWSIFTFLMPGLLGDHRRFGKLYRNPIEQQGDVERQRVLALRLKPFILRRLKTDVAKELPPKTEIIHRVTLADDQRDLYETVRNVMNDKVREEMAAKGFARSQIVILDALLKLRQVCCDPRLVKISAAADVTTSAKLEELMGMLPTLVEDGRKILLFSQFTSMLDLIKPELDKIGLPYVELRGSTKDRRTPIARFQNGEVPLFLISLKAGGTGLNLTAADTVIHFDPWWNPSVENQATDRAHRIGQDKPVFVYKLIAEGTVEERILDLQTRKAQLADALFGDNPSAAAILTPDDIRWLLEPEETKESAAVE